MVLRFRSSASDVVAECGHPDLAGMYAIVTGGNSGIGVETARALATAGAHVVITSRSVEAGEEVAEDIRAGGIKGEVFVRQLDLADLVSVEAFAKTVLQLPQINYLLFNAGVMAVPRKELTADGFELQTGTNHFGHFQLLRLLLPKLQTQNVTSRVVVVSSYAHHFARELPLDDLNWERRSYDGARGWRAYGQSKTCNILLAKELARRAEESGWPIKAYSLHPGSINTNIMRHLGVGGSIVRFVLNTLPFVPGMKTVEQGAATTVYAALAPELDEQSGAYLSDCGVATPSVLARDPELAKGLWVASEKLLDAALEARKASK